MYEFYIARRYLTSRKGKLLSLISSIAVGGIAVGVAALIIAISILNGFHNELKMRILTATPHIVLQQFFSRPIVDYRNLVNRLDSYTFIKSVAPVIYTKTLIRSQEKADGIMVRGVNEEDAKKSFPIGAEIKEGLFSLKNNGIVIGIDLARELGVMAGDTVLITSPFIKPSPLSIPRSKSLVVRGVFDLGHFEYNSNLAFVDIKTIQRLYELDDRVTGIEIQVDDPLKVANYSAILEKDLEYPYHLYNWIEMNKNLFAALKLEKTVTFIVMTLIIIVASFNIIGTLTMIVARKTREIGILKSIGALNTSVARIFMYTGLLIGLIGTAVGLLLGIIIAILVGQYEFIKLPSDVFFISTVPVLIRPLDVILIVVCAIIISFLATIYPARKASRLVPVEAIRNE